MMGKQKKIWIVVILIVVIAVFICTVRMGQKNKESYSLADEDKKEIAMQLVSSSENSSLDWKAQYAYIEDIGDGRGYTAGIIGFCSGTGDMLQLVENYVKDKPGNVLEKYLEALKKVNGTDSHEGLGDAFMEDWKSAAEDTAFQEAQNQLRDEVYFNPAVTCAKEDGLSVLGQFIYYDAIVMHGPGDGSVPGEQSFPGIRASAMEQADTPAEGGDETTYLKAFLEARRAVMRMEEAHEDVDRADAQEKFLDEKNFDLNPPLKWTMYGEEFCIEQ